MIKRIILLMLVMFMGCQSDNSIPLTNSYELNREVTETPNHGDLPQPFIVGGDEVDPACPNCKYEFMVSIQDNSGWHFCGGSLVREDWVVTAAHCVLGDSPSDLSVKIGLHDQYGTSGSETRYVDQVITHPNYDGWSLDNDYALLHLTEPSSFEPIKLITDESHDNDGTWTTTMGWGTTSYGGWSSDVLLEVGVPVDDGCGYIGSEITDNMICAGDEDGGEDSCQGDSGGPLIVEWNGEYELIGIVSWGSGCANAGYPGVYSRIETRKDWFFSYIGEPETEPVVEVAQLGFGNSQGGSIEILLDSPSVVAGFQFELVTTNGFILTVAEGGIAEEMDFQVSSSELGIVLGFSFSGTTIPSGNSVLTNLLYEGEGESEFCLTNAIISDTGAGSFDVEYGDCVIVTANPQAVVTIGDNTLTTLDISVASEVDIAGFQFNITGINVIDAFGGSAETNGFTMSTGGETVLGFSFSGDVIPAGDDVMVTITFEGEQGAEVCLSNVVLSNSGGTPIFTETGDCITLDLIVPGDVNFDGVINVVDIVLVVNYILDALVPNYEETLAADFNQDGAINVVDIVNMVGMVLDTSFSQSVEWLEVNFPQLNTKVRLKNLGVEVK